MEIFEPDHMQGPTQLQAKGYILCKYSTFPPITTNYYMTPKLYFCVIKFSAYQ